MRQTKHFHIDLKFSFSFPTRSVSDWELSQKCIIHPDLFKIPSVVIQGPWKGQSTLWGYAEDLPSHSGEEIVLAMWKARCPCVSHWLWGQWVPEGEGGSLPEPSLELLGARNEKNMCAPLISQQKKPKNQKQQPKRNEGTRSGNSAEKEWEGW